MQFALFLGCLLLESKMRNAAWPFLMLQREPQLIAVVNPVFEKNSFKSFPSSTGYDRSCYLQWPIDGRRAIPLTATGTRVPTRPSRFLRDPHAEESLAQIRSRRNIPSRLPTIVQNADLSNPLHEGCCLPGGRGTGRIFHLQDFSDQQSWSHPAIDQ